MKKFIASLLCVVMALTSMSFAVTAEGSVEVKTDRAINIYVDTNEVYAKDGEDIVTVTVKIEGRDDLANANYTLEYEPALFELQETDKDPSKSGSISEMFYKTKGTYTDGDELATYTFKAIPQLQEKTGNFSMSEAFTYTHIESIEHEKFKASSEGKDVTIKLIEYEVKKYIDGDLVDESEGPVVSDSFPYDDQTHTFYVETVPEATVEYKVNGKTESAVEIKEEGTYVIEYIVTNAIGHGPVTNNKFTIVIEKPEYVVEVAENYVFADDIGKNLVLVYAKAKNVGFNYGSNVMVDVSTSNYVYNDNETDDYDYVYGFVTAPIENGTLADYEDMISHWYGDEYEMDAVGTYDEDLNYDLTHDMQDITVAYGVMNGFEGYFTEAKYQKNLLKADITGNKKVRGDDAGLIVEAAKN